ncbi:MAG: hypothetical protein HYW56_01865 [Candidatus Harrisonbacteria bacterium]|nr:hypothetical protein [Candidatus Harrisonbacteria bacterium]MBI2604266.1 hypothetical protein [Candidatus Harrisonbacteria bacterium]
MRKSVSKRIKVTKTGKLMRRVMAQDHFKSKHPGSRTRAKRRGTSLYGKNVKVFGRYLHTKSSTL